MSTPQDKARAPIVHELKCHPGPFQAVNDGSKPFEWRKDDRDYRVGDTLRLREWIPNEGVINGIKVYGHYTGDELTRAVTYIIREGFGIPEGYCIMGLSREHSPDIVERTVEAVSSWAEFSFVIGGIAPHKLQDLRTRITPTDTLDTE